MRDYKRIHIIGSTGSGKTYLAEALSKKYNIGSYELDIVMWSSREELSAKNPPETRDKLLHNIIDKQEWIVEGVYYKWLAQSFERADVIYFLDTYILLRDVRIITRFIKQKLGIERSIYNQTVKGLISMLKWNHEFEKVYKSQIFEFLEPYKKKIQTISDNKEFKKLINS